MSRVTYGIVADVRRQQEAWGLANIVDARVVSLDDGTLGCTRNHVKVWTKLQQHGGDWLVVLEDDAVPCPGFTDQIREALDNAPAEIVGLYLGKGYPKAWQRFIKKATADEQANYVVSSHLLHGVGTAIKAHLVNDMLRFIGSMCEQDWPIDERITHWMRLRGNAIAYTLPSLVDHADGESLVVHPDGEGRAAERKAWRFGTRPMWDGTRTVEMP